MKALVLNAGGRGFDFENVDIAPPIGGEVLVDACASGHLGCVTPTCYSLLTESSQGRMNLDDLLVSKRISLPEVNEGYAALEVARSRVSWLFRSNSKLTYKENPDDSSHGQSHD